MSITTLTLPSGLWDALQRIERVAAGRTTDAARCVVAVERHRLLPLAVLQASIWPAALRDLLEARISERLPIWRARQRDQRAALARMIDVLSKLDVIVVKGADVASRLYGDALLRPMDDVDLLLRESNLLPAVDTLSQAGWLLTRRTHLEVTMRDPQTGVSVDLYRGYTQDERAAIRKDAFWERATRGEHGAWSLCLSHALLMECLVFANAQFASHLRRLVDLWLLARTPGVVDEAIELALQWELRRPLFAAMRQLEQVAPEIREMPWHDRLQGVISPSERRLLERHVLPSHAVVGYDAPSRTPAMARLRAKLILIDTPARAAHFLAAHAWRVVLGRH